MIEIHDANMTEGKTKSHRVYQPLQECQWKGDILHHPESVARFLPAFQLVISKEL